MNVYLQCDVSSRDNTDLVSGLTRDVSGCLEQKGKLGPGTLGDNLVSGLTRDVCRRDNSDLGLWGTTWSVDQLGMSPVILNRRDNSDLGL